MTNKPTLKMGNREWAMLLLLSFLWSVSFLFINITVRQLPPFTIVLARVGLSFSLITWGQIETPVGLTSIILAATPLVTVTLAHFLTPDEPLGAAFFYGMTAIYARRYRDLPPMVVTTCMLLCTTILLVPITLWIDQPWTLRPDGLTLGALAGLAVLSTALAYIIYFEILATAGATSAALVTFLITAYWEWL